MNITLNIGFVCTAISPYYAEEYKVRDKSEKQLKKILENFNVKLICFHKTIFTKDDSIEAEVFFRNKVDFYLFRLALVVLVNNYILLLILQIKLVFGQYLTKK